MMKHLWGLERLMDDGAQSTLEAGPMPQNESNADARFDEMIRGEFKDAYQSRMQAAIDRRFKQTRALEERMKALEPVTQALSRYYGVEERDLPRAMEQAGAQRQQTRAAMEKQAEEAKKAYPSFDLGKELGNPRFVSMVKSGLDLTTAYEVAHKDELLSGAVAYAAQKAAKSTADSIRMRAGRPSENGLNAQAAAQPRSKTVAEMTPQERQDLIRRAMSGERIVL